MAIARPSVAYGNHAGPFGLGTWDGKEPILRVLQVDELRRAMGFPKQYRFEHGVRRDKIKMIGNGVCPPVMAAVDVMPQKFPQDGALARLACHAGATHHGPISVI